MRPGSPPLAAPLFLRCWVSVAECVLDHVERRLRRRLFRCCPLGLGEH
ncbi:MAG: hypothetical protein QOK08_1587, partial [Actinomycetota bacterium]|nr:hypothetical protein [Actinomycetota bacterium]